MAGAYRPGLCTPDNPYGAPRDPASALSSSVAFPGLVTTPGVTGGDLEIPFELTAGFDVDPVLASYLLAMNEQWAQANKPEDALYYRECRAALACCYEEGVLQSSGYMPGSTQASVGSDPFLDALAGAATSPTNLPGNVAGAGMALWSMATMRPLITSADMKLLESALENKGRVSINMRNGGIVELYDGNANARRSARGKAAKLKFPPKMRLRITKVPGVFVQHMGAGYQFKGGMWRADVTQRSVAALRKLPTSSAWTAGGRSLRGIPVRNLVAGNAVGAVLAFGPQAVSDARAAGNGSEFAKLSMQNQASNLVGFGAGVAVGIIGGAVAAPAVVVFVAALGIGIAAQAVFSSSGAEQSWKSAVDGWFQ
jgi:hypothetical protein